MVDMTKMIYNCHMADWLAHSRRYDDDVIRGKGNDVTMEQCRNAAILV